MQSQVLAGLCVCTLLDAGCSLLFTTQESPDGDGVIDAGSTDIDGDVDAASQCEDDLTGWSQVGAVINPVMGADASEFDIIVDSQNNPVVAISEGNPRDVHVFLYTEGTWNGVGSKHDMNPDMTSTYSPTLAAGPDGTLALAFVETISGGESGLYAKRWNGSMWNSLGGANLTATHPSGGLDIEVAEGGTVILASSEYLAGEIGRNRIHLRRLQGSFSQELEPLLGGIAGPGASAISPQLVLDSSGQENLLFSESGVHLRRRNSEDSAWDPGAPITPITTGSGAHSPRLAIDSSDRLYALVAQYDDNTSTSNGFVMGYTGESWIQIGGTLNEVVGVHTYVHSITVDGLNRPVIAYLEDGQLYIKRFSDLDFVSLGELPTSLTNPTGIRLVADDCGILAAIRHDVEDETSISVFRYVEGP